VQNFSFHLAGGHKINVMLKHDTPVQTAKLLQIFEYFRSWTVTKILKFVLTKIALSFSVLPAGPQFSARLKFWRRHFTPISLTPKNLLRKFVRFSSQISHRKHFFCPPRIFPG